MTPPRVLVGPFYIVGASTRDGAHRFGLSLEEVIEGHTHMVSREIVRTVWLRATCSCGWRAGAKQRTSLEENSHWRWEQHVLGQKNEDEEDEYEC